MYIYIGNSLFFFHSSSKTQIDKMRWWAIDLYLQSLLQNSDSSRSQSKGTFPSIIMEQPSNVINKFIILLSTYDKLISRPDQSIIPYGVYKYHLARKHAMANELLDLNRASKLPLNNKTII